MDLEFHEVYPMERAELERLLSSGNEKAIIDALLSAAFYDPGWRWVQATSLGFLDHPEKWSCEIPPSDQMSKMCSPRSGSNCVLNEVASGYYSPRTAALTGCDPTGITVSNAHLNRLPAKVEARSTATSPDLRFSTSA